MGDEKRHYFEQQAASWDERLPLDLADQLERLLAPFAPELAAASRILEIGSGTGWLAAALRAHAPAARLLCIDFAHAMLAAARQRSLEVAFVQAEAERLPVQSAAVDVVICHNSFPHFDDRERSLAEIGRVLRPAGHLLIVHNLARGVVNAIHQAAGGPIAHDELLPAGALHELLRCAGYQAIAIEDAPARYTARAQWPGGTA
ncbi:MAG: methyltransferase domain-containing protein [Aggregatilineales bacterium]